MAERHKSKYKKPENKKPTYRKDLKDYTYDDKKGGLNPKSTGDKQLNVLRKKDKPLQDDGKMYPTYNADDRLYKDIEDGEWEPKTAAKRLKKRQDAEEKETANVLRDKIENLTREQRERLIREYIRRKLIPIILEQPTKTDDTKAADTKAPTPTNATPTDAPSTPTDAGAETEEPTPTDADSDKQVAPETKETIDLDRFIKYLKKQDGMIARIKVLIKAMNLSMNETDPADQINFYKMLRSTA
ncbi:MAG: hypothetical protein EBT26_00915, partial [Microbacteriaceae bacterium]|nr:hypothetical protein [Microbacteriaceae bacterium]